jgi:hypothetical protein
VLDVNEGQRGAEEHDGAPVLFRHRQLGR